MSNATRSIWTRLMEIAETRPMSREFARLGAITDTELAARGLTRDGEIRRILGTRLYY